MKQMKIILNDMFIIVAAMVFVLGIEEMIMHFTRNMESFEMPWYIPLTIIFTAFLCALPSPLINDCDELNKKQISFRVFLHFICLKMVVTICGFLFGWYSSGAEYMVILLVFVIIYVSVWGISWWLSKRDEEMINIALRKNRDAE